MARQDRHEPAKFASYSRSCYTKSHRLGSEHRLPELFGNVLSVYQGRIANASVRINRRSTASKHVHCYEGEIRQVLANLISNALDAMPSGGTLYLRSRGATNWRNGERGIAITIADTGIGMLSDTRQRLFRPFFTTKGLTGTGLGLWVSKGIIDSQSFTNQ